MSDSEPRQQQPDESEEVSVHTNNGGRDEVCEHTDSSYTEVKSRDNNFVCSVCNRGSGRVVVEDTTRPVAGTAWRIVVEDTTRSVAGRAWRIGVWVYWAFVAWFAMGTIVQVAFPGLLTQSPIEASNRPEISFQSLVSIVSLGFSLLHLWISSSRAGSQDSARLQGPLQIPGSRLLPDSEHSRSNAPLLSGSSTGSDEEQPHPMTVRRMPSTDATAVTASSETESHEDDFSDTDAYLDWNDRLLNPNGYLDIIKRLRQMVSQNSAVKHKNLESKQTSGRMTLRFELHELIINIAKSLRGLQAAGFCSTFFSVLVLDRSRPNVAMLMSIDIAAIEQFGPFFDRPTGESLELACRKLLLQLQILPSRFESLSPEILCATAVHFLDLAVHSYVGTHIEDLDDTYRVDDTLYIPGRFGALRESNRELLSDQHMISVQRRKLQCLHQFLGCRSVWVFQDAKADTIDSGLYLSTDVCTLSDIWGPLWKVKPDTEPLKVSRYDIGSGYIVPWDRDSESDPEPHTNDEEEREVFCHWIFSRDWDDEYVEQHQSDALSKTFLETDRLVIGASVKDRLAINSGCNMSMDRKLKIKQDFKNAGNLRHRGTRRPRKEKGSQLFQFQASAAGYATLGTTLEYKRIGGFSMKDALLQRWRNESRNLKYLEMWGGVEVSLCTQNTRRIQLLHLLQNRGLRKYLKTISFQWVDRACEIMYFEALRDRRSFQKFWTEHPAWQKNIGDAINECFLALEETGVDDRDDELSALWVEDFEGNEGEIIDSEGIFISAEENLVVLRRSEHSWTGLLRDSPECLTMAIVADICLDLNDSDDFGMRCQDLRLSQDERITNRFSPGYTVLQTAILINEDLLEAFQLCYRPFPLPPNIAECFKYHNNAWKRSKCKKGQPQAVDPAGYLKEHFSDASHVWKGYWNTTNLGEGAKFSLGSHGHLKVLSKSAAGYPVLMEWQPVLNPVGKEAKVEIQERAFGKSGDRHHSEYMSGTFLLSPLPCLIISSTKPSRRKKGAFDSQ